MKRIIKKLLTAALVLISTIPAAAKDGIYGSAGSKFIYSKDESISQTYYKPFTVIGWQGNIFDISVSYYRWISYSITDALLNSNEININQPGADLTIYAGDIFSISGGYSYMSGESSYAAHKATGEIMLDFETIDITADSSIKNTEYDFNGIIKNTSITAGGEISFDINDNFSWDIGYQREFTDYKTYGYTYSKNSGRIGIIAAPDKNLFFMSGVTGGSDSDDIITAAFDAGLTVKIFEHLKLSAAYMLTADFISSTTSSKKGSSTTSTDTQISHTGNISVSLYF